MLGFHPISTLPISTLELDVTEIAAVASGGDAGGSGGFEFLLKPRDRELEKLHRELLAKERRKLVLKVEGEPLKKEEVRELRDSLVDALAARGTSIKGVKEQAADMEEEVLLLLLLFTP